MRNNLKKLAEQYTDVNFVENFKRLYALRELFYQCVSERNYTVPPIIDDAIVLSASGDFLFKSLKKGKNKSIANELIKFSIFLEFYHQDLFIDVLNTNIEELENLLNDQILSGSVSYPWTYGRTLYDKYFNMNDEQENLLEYTKVIDLLKDTPKGVFQIDKYVVGPFGLLETKTNRILRPKTRIKLWHCSDVSCTKFHEAELSSGESMIMHLLDKISQELTHYVPSDWGNFFGSLVQDEDFYFDSNRISETASLLADTLGTNEIRLLLKEVIDTNSGFRNQIPDKKKLKGQSGEIVRGLDKSSCLQLLLLENDENIIISLEKLVDRNDIFIPATEIRKSVTQSPKGFYRIHHEFNKLGIRPVSTETNLGLRQLNNLINKIYSEPALQQQLNWKLRYHNKETLKEKIEAYTLIEEPRKVIRETILDGPTQINHTFKYLIGNFKMPTQVTEEEELIDKILWKLGFDVNIYPNNLRKFWERLAEFKSAADLLTTSTELEKEKVRSAAVNFWISLEEALEYSLSFIT